MHPIPIRKRSTLVLSLVLLLALTLGGWLAWQRPSHARDWRVDQQRLPRVSFQGDLVHVSDVRDFRWPSDTAPEVRYVDRSYALERLRRVWFLVSPFGSGWRGPAHTFLSFEFDDGQFVSVSMEARRERGEKYSIWKGLLRRYEVIYVVGTEEDLVGLRAVTWNDPVHLYPVRATREQARQLFVRMMRQAQAIEREPEFYNTLTRNCVLAISREVNGFAERKIPFGRGILLPGYSDQLALELGLIDTDLALQAARSHFLINDRARAAWGRPDFSQRIRRPREAVAGGGGR